MNITIITPVYLPSMGGLQIHVREIAVGLKQKGHDIAVVTANLKNPWLWFDNDGNDVYPQEETIEDISIIRLSPRFKWFWKLVHYFCYKSNIPGSYRLCRKILGDKLELSRGPWIYGKKAIIKNNPDIIVIFAPYFRLIQDCMSIKQKTSVPIVILPLFHVKVQKVEPYLQRLLMEADLIFPSTVLEVNSFVAKGIDQSKIHILGCGLTPDEIRYPLPEPEVIKKYNLKNTFNICYIGRLDVDKGVLDLIKAFEILSAKTEDVSLVLAGSRIDNTILIMNYIDSFPLD